MKYCKKALNLIFLSMFSQWTCGAVQSQLTDFGNGQMTTFMFQESTHIQGSTNKKKRHWNTSHQNAV